MNEEQHRALSTLSFNLVPVPEDVWRPSDSHVPDLHRPVVDSIFDGVSMARYNSGNPDGVVVQGQAGSGKTHMLGMVRERTQKEESGYFFLVNLYSGSEFWPTVAMAVGNGLRRPGFGWPSQLVTFLRRVTSEIGMSIEDRDAISGETPVTKEVLDRFIRALRTYDSVLGRETQHTARALALMASADFGAQDVADGYMESLDGADWSEWIAWGLPPAARPPRLIVEDVSRLLALTGPTVIAFDQLDMLFAQATGEWTSGINPELPPDQQTMIAQVAEGLVGLREIVQRTLLIIACIPATWQLMRSQAALPFKDRFRESSPIGVIFDSTIGRAIVAKHLAAHWKKIDFAAPYDIWPMAPGALDESGDYTARNLLRLVHRQAKNCLTGEALAGRATLDGADNWPTEEIPVPRDDPSIDDLFDRLVEQAQVAAALDHTTEDEYLPPLLEAGLSAWIIEQQGRGVYKVDPPPGDSPPLHARLRQVLDEQTEDERHWAIRGISSRHHGAVRARITKACLAAGLLSGVGKRRLVLLRNSSWDLGVKTWQMVQQFRDEGGLTLTVDEQDLRVFEALRQLLDDRPPGLAEWLAASRPAGSTRLLRELFAGTPAAAEPRPTTDEPRSTAIELRRAAALRPSGAALRPAAIGLRAAVTGLRATAAEALPVARGTPQVRPDLSLRPRPYLRGPRPPEPRNGTAPESFPVGRRVDDGSAVRVPLDALRKHTAIFAGSGSGKTVLIRRMVEECALAGVSSIVLDPNNDLARLGEPWPAPPEGWGEGDADKARHYLAGTEVVIWTPLVNRGNPLTFQPLPNFDAVRHDPDELRAAVDIAVAALAPRAKMDAGTAKGTRGHAVLRSALYHFARRSARSDLGAFIDVLHDLPEDATDLLSGPRLAREMGETLSAVRINDPLFGGTGTAMDPGVLLTPAHGRRARVSVISFVGLNSDEQRQAFVNQLQMALFAWIKRNPAGDRPLGGLFVMDEAQNFAPSAGSTPCTESALQLASQARKYGLGLMFATQAPKGLHNRIPGNATTQFFGLLGAQVQQAAAREMAQAKGSAMPDIGLLTRGEFYMAGEGSGFEKIRTPLCLSHHPASPLTPEQVVERAAQSVLTARA